MKQLKMMTNVRHTFHIKRAALRRQTPGFTGMMNVVIIWVKFYLVWKESYEATLWVNYRQSAAHPGRLGRWSLSSQTGVGNSVPSGRGFASWDTVSPLWHHATSFFPQSQRPLVKDSTSDFFYRRAWTRGSSRKMPAHKVGGGRASQVLNPNFGPW